MYVPEVGIVLGSIGITILAVGIVLLLILRVRDQGEVRFTVQVANEELQCAVCNREIQSGELYVSRATDTGSRANIVTCADCDI